MLKKNILFFALAALLLAGCSGGGTISMPAVQYGGGTAQGLSVNGRGQVNLPPDIAYVTIGVHASGPNVSQVVANNAAQVAEVMQALADMGIAPEDMQTSNFNVYASDTYDPATGLSTGTNYSVDNQVNVTSRDLARLGELLDRAVNAGANSIYGVTFDVENKDAALADARNMALEDAKTVGQDLASAAGLTLGDIINLNYTDTGYYAPLYGGGYGGGGGEGAPTSIVPGLISVSAEVFITYQIK